MKEQMVFKYLIIWIRDLIRISDFSLLGHRESPSREPDGQHRAGGFPHHLLSRAPEEDMIQTCPSMGPHHNEVNGIFLRPLDDLDERLPFFKGDMIILEPSHFFYVVGSELS